MLRPTLLCLASFVILLFHSCCNCKKENIKDETISIMDLGDDGIADSLDSSGVTQRRDMSSSVLYGIDISRYQGTVINEIGTIKNLHFVICKATQGINYVDPDFRRNWREIDEKGLIRGAYHFYVCADDPIQQAIHFSNQISDIESSDIAPVLDIEQGSMTSNIDNNKMQNDLLIFLQKVETITGRKPILYTDYAFAQEFLKMEDFAGYDLWLAEYSGGPQPKIPNVWQYKGFKIWQKRDNYSVHSVETDFDVHFGSVNDLIR